MRFKFSILVVAGLLGTASGCAGDDNLCREPSASELGRIERGLNPGYSLRFASAVDGDLFSNVFVAGDVQGPGFTSDRDLATWMVLGDPGSILAGEGLAKRASRFRSWAGMDGAFFYIHDGTARPFAEIARQCAKSERHMG